MFSLLWLICLIFLHQSTATPTEARDTRTSIELDLSNIGQPVRNLVNDVSDDITGQIASVHPKACASTSVVVDPVDPSSWMDSITDTINDIIAAVQLGIGDTVGALIGGAGLSNIPGLVAIIAAGLVVAAIAIPGVPVLRRGDDDVDAHQLEYDFLNELPAYFPDEYYQPVARSLKTTGNLAKMFYSAYKKYNAMQS